MGPQMLATLDKALALRNTQLFGGLTAEALMPVANLCTEVMVDTGEVLFYEGDIGEAMYILLRGEVSLRRKEFVVAQIQAGECVGELSAFDWNPHSTTAVAEAPTALLRLDRNDLLDLIFDHSEIATALAAVLVARVRGMKPTD